MFCLVQRITATLNRRHSPQRLNDRIYMVSAHLHGTLRYLALTGPLAKVKLNCITPQQHNLIKCTRHAAPERCKFAKPLQQWTVIQQYGDW